MSSEDYDEMRHALWQRGVLPHHPDQLAPHLQRQYPGHTAHGTLPMWRTELGHNILMMPPSGDEGWHFSIRHHGDPTMTMLRGDAGHDPEQAADTMARVLTHRGTMGHMRDMYQRAHLNNDPSGLDEAARRDPATGRTNDIWLN